jgi:hypothetical protein
MFLTENYTIPYNIVQTVQTVHLELQSYNNGRSVIFHVIKVYVDVEVVVCLFFVSVKLSASRSRPLYTWGN